MNEQNAEKKKYPFIKIFLRVIPMQYSAAPGMNTFLIIIGAFHALMWTASIIATRGLFDAIAEAAAGRAGFGGCVTPLLLLAAATFGQQILNGVHNFMHRVVGDKVTGRILSRLHYKLQRVDPALFEETGFLDDLNKAREATGIIYFFCSIVYTLVCFYGVYFASIGVYLFALKPVLLFTLLAAFIPAMLAQIVRARVFTKLEEENAPLRREYEYYQSAVCSREYFKETRILGAFGFFHKLFAGTMALLTEKTWRAERKTALLQLMLSGATFIGMAAASYMLFTATMAGEITVGAFAAVFSALGTVFSIMQEIVTQHIGAINKDIGKVANFVRMMDMPERTGADGTADFSKGVSAERVSFTYPGKDGPAVNDVSLTIKNGETIAIVGENGAGKSTLVRLLTGIYRPTAGTVTVGGLNTAETAPASVFNGMSGVFQKYQRYKMTLGENISISDTGAAFDAERAGTALRETDAELDAGFDDMLSPEFDGIDLSGGQWQRLAIARGLYRVNGCIVLDEPTSAIDPIEETRIYTQFQRLAEGKCAVVVTHRLGSAKLAHRIIVMDGGRITDAGTHEELLARTGKYADMWAAQVKWYERETENA